MVLGQSLLPGGAFGCGTIARLTYAALRTFRNLTLRMLGRTKLNG